MSDINPGRFHMSRFTRKFSSLFAALLGVVTVAGILTAGSASAQSPTHVRSAVDHQPVIAVHAKPGGGRVETIYDPAPGVSSTALANSLRAHGVVGVRADQAGTVKAPSAVATPAATCSYGTATTWGCPMARWSYSGHSHPQIDFLDHTSSAWPLTAVVPEWNLTHGIDSWYRWYTQGCPGSTYHCVNVYNANYGATGWTGMTTRSVNSSNYITSAYVQLNDYYGGTAAQHRNTACHETGHVLGLGHNGSTGSCLYYARTSQQYPSSQDFALLETYY
jgi:hypothetical protein